MPGALRLAPVLGALGSSTPRICRCLLVGVAEFSAGPRRQIAVGKRAGAGNHRLPGIAVGAAEFLSSPRRRELPKPEEERASRTASPTLEGIAPTLEVPYPSAWSVLRVISSEMRRFWHGFRD
jgi:hypothetical protein